MEPRVVHNPGTVVNNAVDQCSSALDVWDHVSGTDAKHPVDLHFLEQLRNTLSSLGKSVPLRVLDFGGGAGNPSIGLAAAGFTVGLVDRDPAMVAAARHRARLSHANFPIVQCDWRKIEACGDAAHLCHTHWDVILLLGNALGYQDSWPNAPLPSTAPHEHLAETFRLCGRLLTQPGLILVETALEAGGAVDFAYARLMHVRCQSESHTRHSLWMVHCSPTSTERLVDTCVLSRTLDQGKNEVIARIAFRGYYLTLQTLDAIAQSVGFKRIGSPVPLREMLDTVAYTRSC